MARSDVCHLLTGSLSLCWSDYLELRHAAQLSERKLKERASALSQQQFDLHKHLKEVETKAVVRNGNYTRACRDKRASRAWPNWR